MSTNLNALTRVGKISYLNCLPFYHRLLPQAGEPASFRIYESYPTRINLAMRRGHLNIAPISSLEYANHQDLYMLLPGLAIGSRDFSGSVILFSKEKIDNLDGKKIVLSRQSLSSATLLKILFRFKYKFKCQFIVSGGTCKEMLEAGDAALAIGDEALFFEPKDFVYKYDLSELWWNWTEKPFCFAVWAVNKNHARKNPEEVRLFAKEMRDNLKRNLSDIEGLLKDALQISFLDPKFPKVYGYFFNLLFCMDESLQEGLELFYRLAYRLGVSPKPKPVRFFE